MGELAILGTRRSGGARPSGTPGAWCGPASLLWLLLAGSACDGGADGRVSPDAYGEPRQTREVRVRVRSEVAGLGHAADRVRSTGTARPWRVAHLRAEVGGRVEALEVRNGDRVAEGDLLLRLEADHQAIAMDAAGAQLAAVEEDAARAAEHLARMEALAGERAVSPAQRDAAEHDLRRAEAAVRAARAERRGAGRRRADTRVRSPIPGVVTGRSVELGDTVIPAAPLLDVVDLSRVRITVGVTGRELARLADRGESGEALGAPVVRVSDLGGDLLEGAQIVALAPMADPRTGRFEVELEAPNPGERVRGGMVVEVELPLAPALPRVLVPREALTRRDGQLAVFELVDGRARFRPVQTGAQDAVWVEVLRGLEAGAEVAVTGLHTLAEGVAVEVEAEGEAGP